jgi:hypothetical protein
MLKENPAFAPGFSCLFTSLENASTKNRRQKKTIHSGKILNYSKIPCVPTFNHYSQRRPSAAGHDPGA